MTLAMYLVFDPNTFINNMKAVLTGVIILAVLYKIAMAVGFGKIQAAAVGVFIGAIGFMVVQQTLIQDVAAWAKANGLG